VVGYLRDDLTPEQIEAERALHAPFAAAVRDLVDATVRTEVDAEEVRAVQAEVEALTARLRARQIEGAYGVRHSADGTSRPWGNAVVGLRNPIAPPLDVQRHPDATGEVWADFTLGAVYEGPSGLVHGGVTSLVLDQVLGESAGAAKRPGMTATLELTYRRPTPLGPLRAEAWVDRTDGFKTWCRGRLIGPEGTTVEAEGLFILPRWAREQQTPVGDSGQVSG